MQNKIKLGVALCVLLSFSFPGVADEIQEANKLFKQGQKAQALEKANGFLATTPKDAQARFLKGLIINEQGNTDEAIKIFSELTDDYPELPEPYNNLAVLYASKGQYEKAKVALEMAIRTHPNYATAHANLGDIYAKMASQSYERALQLDKTNTSTQTKFALIRELFSKGQGASKAAQATVSETSASATTPPLPPVSVSNDSIATKPVVAPVESKPAPMTVTTATVDSAPVTDESAQVLNATLDWAAAWSAKDSKRYLAYYSKSFKTPEGKNRGAWEAQRKKSIADAKSIQIVVGDTKVKVINDQNVSVSFRQSLRTSHLKTISRKTLLWVKEGGQWQIAEEQTVK